MGKKSDAKLVESTMNAIGILWHLGSQIQAMPVPRGKGPGESLDGLLFLLVCEPGRGEVPLMLTAMDGTNLWFLADPLASDGLSVTLCGDVEKVAELDAITIGAGVILQALKTQNQSERHAAWIQYLEQNLMPDFFQHIRGSMNSHDRLLSVHASGTFRKVLQGYEDYPRPDSPIGQVLSLMKSEGMTY